MLLSAVLLSCSALAVGAAAYVYIAGQLPSPEELTIRTDTFESTKIYDRHGALLYEIFHPTAGRRTVVDLDRIPMYLRQATIATEDPTFYDNPGFSPRDILRAFVQNLREGGIVSGASTITQQVVKTAFLSPEVSWTRKIKEAVLATEVTRRYSKDEILEIYLNQSYYGNLAYGIGTAAEVYFRKPVEQLTLAEATMLAGIPQGPAIYDPYTNLAAAKLRQSIVLDLMVRRGYLTRDQAQQVLAEPLAFQPGNIEMIAPHFVVYVREQLEAQYGTDLVYRGGLRVYTSLDLTLQDAAERSIRQRLDELKELEATSASLVAMDPQSGQILAMVGSADFFGEAIDGQVNVALQLRQPGSSIKPITYVAAFEKGWTPATMIMDITSEFPDGANPPYVPHNHDQKEHGPVLVRGALARSLNIPAVKTLQFVTLPSMLEMAHRLGVTSLNRPDYGLALTLGGGDVTLLEMTGAYASFANRGHRVRPVSILRIEDSSGRVIAQASEDAGQRILEPQHAYLITNILSDNEGRLPTFGPGNILELSRPAAVKTGTTDDYRDAWTIGYTPGLVTGVWVGNADGSPMNRVFGSRGAGPIWHDFMEEALRDQPVEEFPVPQGIETAVICPISGKLRSEKCPPGVREMFAEGTAPTATCDVHVDVRICRVSLRRAGEFCPASVVTTQYFEVYPPEYRSWAEANGKPQPPLDLCHVHVQAPRVVIDQPSDGSLVEGIVPVYGSARLDDFHHFEVQYGIGENPIGWGQVLWEDSALVDSLLGAWDTRALPNALYSLRVVVFDRQGNSLVSPGVRVRVLNPTPTPTLTSTPSPTPTWTPTATVSATLSATPTTAATPTYTLQPSEPVPTTTPQPTATSVPEQTPTSTQQPTATYTPEPTPTANPSPSPTQPGSTVTPTILPEPPATPAT